MSINKSSMVPVNAAIVSGIIAFIIALFIDITVLVDTISLGILLNYSMVDLGLVIKRY